MHLSHHRRVLLPTETLRRREHGYIMVMFALLLVPLLLMAGFAVDVGSWYSRASDIQKAADSAALAGVVWLPDVGKATTYAKEAAARNGFTTGVTVTRVGERQLRVIIADPAVGSFFYGSITGKTIGLERSGLAEYVLPVPLGSPDFRFGNDPTDLTYTQPNLWGNIHGPRTDSDKGDAFATACKGSGDNCAGIQNPGYRTNGYLYTIDVPANTTGLDVQVYDAGFYDRGSDESVDTGDRKYSATGSVTTTWTMYDTDATPLTVDDNPEASTTTLCTAGAKTWALAEGQDAATYKNNWSSICARSGLIPAGRYLLRVATSGDGSIANRYAIKVLSTSTAKARISGYGDMSMFNNISTGGTNATASFYLAEVDQIHKGKTFRVSMYDPGEVSQFNGLGGDGTIQILQPDGSIAANCVASTTAPASSGITNGSTLSSCQFVTASGGSARFNGHWITLDIPIPTTYACTINTLPGCWWKVKYIINGKASDTTTWAAQIIGDPVHLLAG